MHGLFRGGIKRYILQLCVLVTEPPYARLSSNVSVCVHVLSDVIVGDPILLGRINETVEFVYDLVGLWIGCI